MDNEDHRDKKVDKDGEDMSAVLEKSDDIKEKLARITAKASPLTTKNRMIELDPNNPKHKEWFDEDEND